MDETTFGDSERSRIYERRTGLRGDSPVVTDFTSWVQGCDPAATTAPPCFPLFRTCGTLLEPSAMVNNNQMKKVSCPSTHIHSSMVLR